MLRKKNYFKFSLISYLATIAVVSGVYLARDYIEGDKKTTNTIYCPIANIFKQDTRNIKVRLFLDENLSNNSPFGQNDDVWKEIQLSNAKTAIEGTSYLLEKEAGIKLIRDSEKHISLESLGKDKHIDLDAFEKASDTLFGDYDGISILLTDNIFDFPKKHKNSICVVRKNINFIILEDYNNYWTEQNITHIRDTLMHEFGHLFYADHLENTNCIMHGWNGDQQLCEETIKKLKFYRHRLW